MSMLNLTGKDVCPQALHTIVSVPTDPKASTIVNICIDIDEFNKCYNKVFSPTLSKPRLFGNTLCSSLDIQKFTQVH